jgi:hypothetical protein
MTSFFLPQRPESKSWESIDQRCRTPDVVNRLSLRFANPKDRRRALAFASGLHPRLGARSLLDLIRNTVRDIAAMAFGSTPPIIFALLHRDDSTFFRCNWHLPMVMSMVTLWRGGNYNESVVLDAICPLDIEFATPWSAYFVSSESDENDHETMVNVMIHADDDKDTTCISSLRATTRSETADLSYDVVTTSQVTATMRYLCHNEKIVDVVSNFRKHDKFELAKRYVVDEVSDIIAFKGGIVLLPSSVVDKIGQIKIIDPTKNTMITSEIDFSAVPGGTMPDSMIFFSADQFDGSVVLMKNDDIGTTLTYVPLAGILPLRYFAVMIRNNDPELLEYLDRYEEVMHAPIFGHSSGRPRFTTRDARGKRFMYIQDVESIAHTKRIVWLKCCVGSHYERCGTCLATRASFESFVIYVWDCKCTGTCPLIMPTTAGVSAQCGESWDADVPIVVEVDAVEIPIHVRQGLDIKLMDAVTSVVVIPTENGAVFWDVAANTEYATYYRHSHMNFHCRPISCFQVP